ncbi:MAG: DUF4350 domain-containing protein [Armatimonadetes bacterium]|nr:DUF4350 domain-containing protein [Armatimonadota bacterium]
MRYKSDTWIFAAILIILLAGGYLATAPRGSEENMDSTTWNPDPNGVRAFYTLLGERLGYRVARLRKPYDRIPQYARMLIVVQPTRDSQQSMTEKLIDNESIGNRISRSEISALTEWIRSGGTALFFSDNLKGVPSEFRTTKRIGRGNVYAFDSRKPITNQGMRDYRNALRILRIIDLHAGKNGLILFDEYHHGFTESRPLVSYVSRQAWIAVGILMVASLVLCHTRGKRFGAVRKLPDSKRIRLGFEFVESLATLYRKAGATDLAADILRGQLTNQQGQVGQKPTEQELLAIANQIHDVEKERGIG